MLRVDRVAARLGFFTNRRCSSVAKFSVLTRKSPFARTSLFAAVSSFPDFLQFSGYSPPFLRAQTGRRAPPLRRHEARGESQALVIMYLLCGQTVQ